MTEGSENVIITNKDIYAELMRIRDMVQSMQPQESVLRDHESRVRSLERWKYGLPASVAASVIAIVEQLIGSMHGR